ncbi:MAG: hypothetical protein ACYDAD_15165, partial [Acidimicrobiales bacterium]
GRLRSRAGAADLHRFLGALGVVVLFLHVGAVAADRYVDFGPAALVVPFASSWHPDRVAWGILAAWLSLAVEVTSLARRHLPPAWWHRVHRLSLAAFVLATVHGAVAGTDARGRVPHALGVVAVMAVAFGAAARMARPGPAPVVRRSSPGGAAASVPERGSMTG